MHCGDCPSPGALVPISTLLLLTMLQLADQVCVCTYIWHRLKNMALVTGPGDLFATRLVTESAGLATNPPCDKPIEDYSTLHRGPRQGFETEGPRQQYVTEGGGPRQTPDSSHSHICIQGHSYLFIYLSIHLSIYLSIHTSVYSCIDLSVYLVYLSWIYLSVHLSICLSIDRSIYLCIHLSIYVSIYLYLYLYIYTHTPISYLYVYLYLYLYLFVYLSIDLHV